MPYHIPSDDAVVSALREVFSNFPRVDSQHLLKDRVERVLNQDSKDGIGFHVGVSRLRRLVVENSVADIRAETRGDEKRQEFSSCPVCGGSLRSVRNMTLFGGEVAVEVRCEKCGYIAARKKSVPSRYIFVKSKK